MSATLADLFDAPIADYAGPLPLEEELALIAAARDGDRAAEERLLFQYAHALRRAVSGERARLGERGDAQEARANVLLAFTEAVRGARPGERVTQILHSKVLHVADEYHLIDGLTVPARTGRKVMAALRLAGDDVAAAQRIAEEREGVAPETFRAALSALSPQSLDDDHHDAIVGTGNSTTDAGPNRVRDRAEAAGASLTASIAPERDFARVEDVIDTQRALAALDEVGRRIVRDYYGFSDYDVIPDAEIAHRLGMTRPTVQRKRISALLTMHDALCTDERFDERCERDDRHEERHADPLSPAMLAAWEQALAEAVAA